MVILGRPVPAILRVSLRGMACLLTLVGLAAGCAPTLAEVRAKPPVRMLEVPGRYGDLGGCVAAGLQVAPSAGMWGPLKTGDLRLEIVRRDDQQSMTLTAFSPAGMNVPAFDLSFRQGGEQVRIEQRAGHIGRAVLDEAWGIVQQCATRARARVGAERPGRAPKRRPLGDHRRKVRLNPGARRKGVPGMSGSASIVPAGLVVFLPLTPAIDRPERSAGGGWRVSADVA